MKVLKQKSTWVELRKKIDTHRIQFYQDLDVAHVNISLIIWKW